MCIVRVRDRGNKLVGTQVAKTKSAKKNGKHRDNDEEDEGEDGDDGVPCMLEN